MPYPNQGSKTSLSQAEAARLPRLLHMEYSPSELAAELQISVKKVRSKFVVAGCPHRRDARGRIWIVGTAFQDWYEATQVAHRHPMRKGEAWCLRCRQPVRMEGPLTVLTQHYTEIVQGRCPRCGGKVNRTRRRADREDEPCDDTKML